MKRIHISEDKFRLIKESYSGNMAGSDFPSFYDKKTDMQWEASWNQDYGFPFGYWRNCGTYEFSVGDSWSTHVNACGKVVRNYIQAILEEDYENRVDDFIANLEDLAEELKNGYTYDEDNDVYVSEDGDEIDLNNWVYENCDLPNPSVMLEYVEEMIHYDRMPDQYDMVDAMVSASMDGLSFHDEDSIQYALSMFTGRSFQNFFSEGYGEGRIWPNIGLITFYVSEQPEPEVFCRILSELSENPNIGESYDDLMDYFTIFEDFDNDNVVTGCTVRDYISGNYGPETDEGEEPDMERERTYGNGDTQFIPHLASPEEKKRMGVFRDFQNNRDAMWAPRLKGFGGNMAAYKAARYPYSDSRIIRGNVLSESNGNKRKKV